MQIIPALIDVWHGPIYFVIVVVMVLARVAIILGPPTPIGSPWQVHRP